MYRDDLEAAHARTEALQQELANVQAGHAHDRQRIAELTAQLMAAQQALQRLGGGPRPGFYLLRPRGTAVLVLGVLSIMLCNILGPVAWVMGNEELRRIDSGQVDPMTRNAASAGRVCGIVSTMLMLVGVVVGVGFVMLYAMSHGQH
jgi:hypothetical protein